jgi:hypothetical protein
MTAPYWVTPAGFLGTLTERIFTSAVVVGQPAGISFSLISGDLPPGMSLPSYIGQIAGTPLSVPNNQRSTFVIRIENEDGIADRTFSLDVSGPTEPLWATSSGPLPVGINGEYYTINKEYVDYTLRAETDILTTGNTLKYFIADGDGSLPPGLKLTQSGRIFGYVDDNLKLDYNASLSGGYDTEKYDGYPYDHAVIIENIIQLVKPSSINKIYQFYVSTTDGISNSKRLFNIKVVDPDSLRADNTYIQADQNDFDASTGYLLPPLWLDNLGNKLTKVYNLGTIRANREQIISLRDYDPYPYLGPVVFDWALKVNPEIKLTSDGQLNNASRATKNLVGQTSVYFKGVTVFPVRGMKLNIGEFIEGASKLITYNITGVVKTGESTGFINIDQPLASRITDQLIFYVGSASEHPPGMSLDTESGQLYGRLSYQPAYSRSYKFSIKTIKTDVASQGTAYASQIFSLTIRGEIASVIEFTSPSNLGSLIPGEISEVAVVAKNINSPYNLNYELISGTLPVGLSLNSDGTISGRVGFQTQTYFDYGTDGFDSFKLDNGSTTIDQNWYFTVRASDVYRLSAVDKQFYIRVKEDNFKHYTRIFLKPFLSKEKRTIYRNFVTDSTIFDPALLYRPEDPEFGVQPLIKMVVETGIQVADMDQYFYALQTYISRKRFYFGDVKVITAQDSSGTDVYDIVYVEIIDDRMVGTTGASSFTYTVNDQVYSYYPESVDDLQIQLESIEITPGVPISVDDRLQPKYMTTAQADTGIPLGFVKAIPLCYTTPGNSTKVLSRIKSSGFDFKQFDFDTDRIVIENVGAPPDWVYFPTIPTNLTIAPRINQFNTEDGITLTDEFGNPIEEI